MNGSRPSKRSNRIFYHKQGMKKIIPASPSRGSSRSRPAPAFQSSRSRRKVPARGIRNLFIIGFGLFLFIVLLVVLFRSPLIKSIKPQNGTLMNTANPQLEVVFGKKVNADQVKLVLDGNDITSQVQVALPQVTAQLNLGQGAHNLEVLLDGKSKAKAAWMVDSEAPRISLEGMDEKQDGKVVIQGKVDPPTSQLKADQQALGLKSDGSFSLTVDRYERPVVLLTASDQAGNQGTLSVQTVRPVQAKGAHVSIWVAADTPLYKGIVDMVNRTELNSVEIDLKDESGRVGYDTQYPLARLVESATPKGGIDMQRVMDKIWYNDIYSIGRIVCFKDPILAKKRPDLAVRTPDGSLWGNGQWLDPYSKEVWDYNVGIGMEAAKLGFKEIQFDYVRFPSDGNTTTCRYPSKDGRVPEDVIADFLRYARDKLHPLGVVVSADVFGLTASGQGSMGIGQNISKMAQYLDYLSPMVYPSHYNTGEYNIANPEANPHDTVYLSLEDFKKKLEGTNCKLRPWLQDFTLKMPYGASEVLAQIKACYDSGVDEWLLWDAECTFTESALQPQKP